ncbi:site-specific integrase [Bradyrhizobium sp. SZCCHNS1054]|uniref:site-specific integrase n=1 Tax=Bradyrhizobium sp. SZCCHNS1054 TaxID=3057301 RepID=UPI0029170177|nr:site-specific integrase [Bradyrhizobium sp. SZCCHNS1054]
MGIIKDRHGTYYVQRKVPGRLQEAVARVIDAGETRRVFLKKSLGTKNLKEAKAAAPHVLADFGRIIGQAEALLKEQPVVTVLSDAQIKRMAESYYGTMLAEDEEERREGTSSEPLFQSIAEQLNAAGIEYRTPWTVGTVPEAGLSDREIYKRTDTLEFDLALSSPALARGDYTVIREELDELLFAFQLSHLDRKSAAYRKLSMAVLTAHVRGLKDIERRNAGEPIETPQSTSGLLGIPASHKGGTLREALEGWKKERDRPEDGVHEYTRAVEMFIDLHGNLAISAIKRSHASQFREALRQVPKTRKGPLLKAGLLELRQWSQEHPSAPKVSPATVNKQQGAVQAIISWGFRNGLVPDEVPWADPFKDMRVEGEQSTRDAFDPHGLQAVFDAPLFTEQKVPAGGKGPAAVWLPLLAVFMGGRQGEFAALRVSDIRIDDETSIPLMWIVRDTAAGKRVKTDAGERVVPLHPQMIQLGFLDYVARRKAEDGDKAWLFPPVAPDQRGGRKAWAKWWGRYLRDYIGVEDRNLVFHSFRHGFQDALRRATPDEELRDALAGRSAAGKSVSRQYGAKQMLQRWGVQKLHETICNVSFPGLDLSRVQPSVSTVRTRGKKEN